MRCENCGGEFAPTQTETAQVERRDGSHSRVTLCSGCWGEMTPGVWVTIPTGSAAEAEEIRRLYWVCDQCGGVWRHDAILVRVRQVGTAPYPEFIVCPERVEADPSLRSLEDLAAEEAALHQLGRTLLPGLAARPDVEITVTGSTVTYRRTKP